LDIVYIYLFYLNINPYMLCLLIEACNLPNSANFPTIFRCHSHEQLVYTFQNVFITVKFTVQCRDILPWLITGLGPSAASFNEISSRSGSIKNKPHSHFWFDTRWPPNALRGNRYHKHSRCFKHTPCNIINIMRNSYKHHLIIMWHSSVRKHIKHI